MKADHERRKGDARPQPDRKCGQRDQQADGEEGDDRHGPDEPVQRARPSGHLWKPDGRPRGDRLLRHLRGPQRRGVDEIHARNGRVLEDVGNRPRRDIGQEIYRLVGSVACIHVREIQRQPFRRRLAYCCSGS